MDSKHVIKAMKSIAECIQTTRGKTMEVTIDVYTYDELKDYCDRLNEPMSVIATKAIKKYIDAGGYNGTNKL